VHARKLIITVTDRKTKTSLHTTQQKQVSQKHYCMSVETKPRTSPTQLKLAYKYDVS